MRKDKCLVCNDPLDFTDGPNTCRRCAGAAACLVNGHHAFENYDLIPLEHSEEVKFICALCDITVYATVTPIGFI